jgi:hypothetical protein
MPSMTARLNSRLVSVVVRALSNAKPPTNVPRRSESDVDCVSNEMSEATGRGSNVVPDVAGTWLALSPSSGLESLSNMVIHRC